MATPKPIIAEAWLTAPEGNTPVEQLPSDERQRLGAWLKQTWCSELLRGEAEVELAEEKRD